jgi:hypothetical protein
MPGVELVDKQAEKGYLDLAGEDFETSVFDYLWTMGELSRKAIRSEGF